MTVARQRLGRAGEELAAEHLRRRGYRIVARNARTRDGELDIVARDGGALVFVEVKTMREGTLAGPERPVLAVGPRKRLRLRRLARAWLADRGGSGCAEVRFDVVGVRLGPGSEPRIEHIEGAF